MKCTHSATASTAVLAVLILTAGAGTGWGAATISATPVVENIRTYRWGAPHRPGNLGTIVAGFSEYPYQRYPYDYLIDQDYSNYPVANDPYEVYALENEWIRVEVLPAMGGRVQTLVNKITGHNEMYVNPAGFKPAPWGYLKQSPSAGNPWWLGTGGTEFSWPVDEHGFTFYKPFTVAEILDHPGGAPYVELHEFCEEDMQDPAGGAAEPRWRTDIRIRLYDDSAAYEVTILCTNQSGASQDLQFWSNTQCSPGEGNIDWTAGDRKNIDLKFVFPPDVTYMYDHNGWNNFVGGNPNGGDGWKVVDWPVHTNPYASAPQSRDLSLYRTYEQTDTGLIGLFVPDDFGATFCGVYNLADDEGIAKVVPEEIVPGVKSGLKLFHWGSQSDEPWIHGAYSDSSDGTISSYIELMSGPNRLFHHPSNLDGERAVYNPPELPFGPGETVEWTDVYYAPYGIGGFVHAAADAALNLEAPAAATRGATVPVTVGVYPVRRETGGRVEIWIGGAFVYNSGPLDIGPGGDATPFYDVISPVVCADVPTGITEIELRYVFPDGRRERVSAPITIAAEPAGDLDERIAFDGDPGWDDLHHGWGENWTLEYPAGDGAVGGYMRATCGGAGSNVAVEWFAVEPGSVLNVAGWLRCPEHSSLYWAEFAYKLAQSTAELSGGNFDASPGTWTLVQKFCGPDSGLPNGNGNTWTEYSASGIDAGANTWIAVGIKLGSSPAAPPVLGVDEIHVWSDSSSGGPVPPCLEITRASMELF